MTARLPNRLKTAADMCRRGGIVCDVGTDHALLACYLAENGAREVIASDIKDGPLLAARRTIEQTGARNVRTVKSNGLERIDYADDVVIAGMGGELIAEIIGGCRFLSEDTRFILQPMTKAELLRRWLYENGFEICEERSAFDGGRAYVIMLVRFTGVRQQISEVFAYCGKVKDKACLELTARKLLKNAKSMERSAGHAEEALKLRQTAEQILLQAEGSS